MVNAADKPGQDYVETKELQRRLQNFLDYLASSKRNRAANIGPVWQPHIDLHETSEEILLVADVAGVQSDQLLASVDGLSITIAGSREVGAFSEVTTCHQLEISPGRFERTIDLPTYVNAKQAQAFLSNGLLHIALPKSDRSASASVKIRRKPARMAK